MGFLKDLLNPVKAIKMGLDPAGETIRSMTGSKSMLDPSGRLIKSQPGQSGQQTMAAPGAPQLGPGGDAYYGDPNDAAYGSFTKPFDVEEFYKYADPGYAFQLQQGTQALQNSAAANSGALSGAALKDLLKYNQDYAGTAYDAAFNRYQTQQGNIFNRLFDISQLGQNAASNVGAQGTTLAGNAGGAATTAGGALGAGTVGAGNALSQGATNYWLSQYMKTPQPVQGGQV